MLCGRVTQINARSNAASSLSKCLPDVGGGTPVKTLPENRRAANLPSLDWEGMHEAARVHRGSRRRGGVALVARGQRPMKTIGYVSPAAGQNDIDAAFDEALQQRGWVPGKNIIIEKRWTNGRQDTIAPIVAEINALNVDAVVAWSPPIALAMKRSTQVPLVFLITFDPVEVGLVSNLAAPEGNLTGITSPASLEIIAKRLQLLKEVAPSVRSVAVLLSTANT